MLHLRAASDSGGGPEKTIYNTGLLINKDRFLYLIAYLKKSDSDLSLLSQNITNAGLHYFDFIGKRPLDIKQLSEIMKLIKKYGVQILHCHDPKTDFYGLLLRLFFPGLKLVSTMHGWIEKTWISSFYNRLDMFALRSFHKVIAVSGPIQETAANSGLDNISLIHNAINTNEWKPLYPAPAFKILKNIPISPQSFIIGYIGRISREKGPLDFVMVARSLVKRDMQFEFIVAGDGPEINAMKSLAETSGIIDMFHFLGHVNINEMAAVYQKLDVLLSPSLTEGLPNNLLEALAMHVPVVATKVGGVSEVIIHNYNGLLVQPGDIGSMVENIVAIKNDPDMGNKFMENGRHIVEIKFSFEDRVRKIETLYTQLSRSAKN